MTYKNRIIVSITSLIAFLGVLIVFHYMQKIKEDHEFYRVANSFDYKRSVFETDTVVNYVFYGQKLPHFNFSDSAKTFFSAVYILNNLRSLYLRGYELNRVEMKDAHGIIEFKGVKKESKIIFHLKPCGDDLKNSCVINVKLYKPILIGSGRAEDDFSLDELFINKKSVR